MTTSRDDKTAAQEKSNLPHRRMAAGLAGCRRSQPVRGRRTAQSPMAPRGGFRKSLTAWTAVILLSATPTLGQTLLPAGAVWKYLDNGSDQGAAWRASGFDDRGWASGPAQLGYGDGDEATQVSYGADPKHKFITTYFRSSFAVADPSALSTLTLRVRRDDGVAVYLNGTEVFRNNLPAGALYTTLASGSASDGGNTWQVASVSPGLLVAGNNVVAAEIHQAAKSSSDISFDMEVRANVPPTVTLASPSSGATIQAPAQITLKATAADSDGTIRKVEFYEGATLLGRDTSPPFSITWSSVPAGAYSLSAKAYDNDGAATPSKAVAVTVVPNSPPTVTITNPASGSECVAGTTLTLAADALDRDGTISAVAFYEGHNFIGASTIAPFTWAWRPSTAGDYDLTARAWDEAGAVTVSTAVRVSVISASIPTTTPQSVVAVAGDGSATLLWMPVANALSYSVKRGTAAAGPFTQVGTAVGSPSHMDNNLVNGTFYFYVVTATTAEGESPDSNVARVTPVAPLPAGSAQWPLSQSGADNADGVRFPFGPRNLGDYDFHAGLDIPAPLGTPIYPVMDGILEDMVDPASGLKKAIIRHGNNQWTQYLHVSGFAPGLTIGQSVTKGTVIAYVGHSDASHDHLHLTYVVKPTNASISEKRSKNPLEILPYAPPVGLTAQWLPDNTVSISLPTHQMSVRWIVLQGGGQTRIADYYDIVAQGSADTERNRQDQYGIHLEAAPPALGDPAADLPFVLQLGPSAPDYYVLERVLLLDFNGQVILDAQKN